MNSITRIIRCLLVFALLSNVGAASIVDAAGVADDRAIENLAVFARLYGYIRFFHPSDEAAAIDWNKFAVVGAAEIRDAPNAETAREKLQQLFSPIVQGLRIQSAAQPVVLQTPARLDGERFTFWQHHGLGPPGRYRTYDSRRVIEGEDEGDRSPYFQPVQRPPMFFRKLIASSVAVEFPLVLPVSQTGRTSLTELPKYETLKSRLAELDLKKLDVADWRIRVAGVISAWNVFQHFHPYLDIVDVHWEEVLTTTLRRALADQTRDDYYATLSEMVAKLQDGHGHVFGGPNVGGLLIRVELVEKEIVITGATEDAGFQKGDVIKRIDGADALEILRERERYVSGSPQLRQYRALNRFGQGPKDSIAQIELLREGAEVRLQVKYLRDRRTHFYNPIAEFQFPRLLEVRPGIYYININYLDLPTLQQRLPELAAARGLIIDQRWNAGWDNTQGDGKIDLKFHITPHLIDQTVRGSLMRVPRICQPDRIGWTATDWTGPVEPKSPRLKGQVVFINTPDLVSAAETYMAIIVGNRLGKLVGGPTAGCNGTVNQLPLPGGFLVMWTGMEVLKHDRSQLYLTGFVPDYPVARTIKAIKEGRDEYLEKAIEVIEQSADPPKP